MLPGDGTGPEVVAEAVKTLFATAEKEAFDLEMTPFDLGGNRYLKTKEILPRASSTN